MKFSFKKHIGSGRSFQRRHSYTNIRLGKKMIGTIWSPMNERPDWTIYVYIKSDRPDPNHQYIEETFKTEPEARQWLQNNIEKVTSLDLYEGYDAATYNI